MTDDVARLVERLSKNVYGEDLMSRWDRWRKKHKEGFGGSATRDEFESIIDGIDAERMEAASTIRALDTKLRDADEVIQRLNSGAELQAIMAAHNDTLAKLREAMEVIRSMVHPSHLCEKFMSNPPLCTKSYAAQKFLATMEKTDGP
jgi:hypothetical protein